VLNPGKKFPDFQAGAPPEDTFTIYHDEVPKGSEGAFRVISHSEQLAVSECKRNSGDRLWCGTCHDPHNEPTEVVTYYRARCLQCHTKTTFATDHPPKTSDCIGCHMPKPTPPTAVHCFYRSPNPAQTGQPDHRRSSSDCSLESAFRYADDT
jgi:hypothetical protein